MSARAIFTVLESGDVCVARISGEIDVSNATDIAGEVLGAVTNEPRALILDVSEVKYLDSSGIGLLFGLVRSLDVRRQRLILVVPAASPLWRVLRVTRLSQVAEIEPDREAAKLAALRVESGPTA